MPFIAQFVDKCLSQSNNHFDLSKILAPEVVPMTPLEVLAKKFVWDLKLPLKTDIGSIETELWNWFNYMLHKGIVLAIASRYGRNDIELIYSFESAKNGDHPSYQSTLSQTDVDYSFNLQYYLADRSWIFEEIFNAVFDFINESVEIIKEEQIDINYIILTFITYGGLVGVQFINSIELTKNDYWPIRKYFISEHASIRDDSDLIDVDLLGSYEEPFLDTHGTFQVMCSFCGEPVITVPKTGEIWRNVGYSPCDHFSFAFITNTGNHFYGMEYYKKYFTRSIIDYVETYKGFTCENNVGAFINDFLNGDTDLDENELAAIVEILKLDYLPACQLQIKQFTKKILGEKHAFLFHFMKFI